MTSSFSLRHELNLACNMPVLVRPNSTDQLKPKRRRRRRLDWLLIRRCAMITESCKFALTPYKHSHCIVISLALHYGRLCTGRPLSLPIVVRPTGTTLSEGNYPRDSQVQILIIIKKQPKQIAPENLARLASGSPMIIVINIILIRAERTAGSCILPAAAAL